MTSVFNREMARRPPKLRRFFGPVTSEIIGYYSRIEWPVDLRYRQQVPVWKKSAEKWVSGKLPSTTGIRNTVAGGIGAA